MKLRNSRSASSLRRGPAARRRKRLGAATVELALCMPVLLTVGLGMIETSNVVFIQARLQSAAYESARLATRPTTSNATAATSEQVTIYCQALLAQLGVNGATVSVTPGSLSNLPPQTLVTVSISAPWSQNTASSFVLSESLTLTTAATLIIE
ncbi:MAG TPA: TadE/TadG family type IV pilus assembly protein [Pirellulales bacterium]|nr:TadE/TadG family type IV pilus assembly protein [Pirellulales bacterium]